MTHVEEVIEPFMASCSDCKTAKYVIQDYVKGEMVCTHCGLVVGDRMIAEGSEWRTFSDGASASKADPNRVGGPENALTEQFGLSTMVGQEDEGGVLGRYQNQTSLKPGQRALMTAFQKVRKLCGQLSLTQGIVDRAVELYTRVHATGEFKGRKVDAVVAAVVFIACRQASVPRTLKEISAVAEASKLDVGRCVAKIKKLKIYKKPTAGAKEAKKQIQDNQAPDSSAYMERYCSLLGLPMAITTAAEHIARRVAQENIAVGKTPATVAGACIYFAAQLYPNEKEKEKASCEQISKVIHMQPGTIRACYKLLLPHRTKLVPTEKFYVDMKFVEAFAG
jgi:transcription initiation factor TFIIB